MSEASGRIERRQFGRRQESAHGWIVVEGRPRFPCMVRDISKGGARIDVDHPSWLPFRFRLIVESQRLDTDCEIRHQQKTSVGVMFIQRRADDRPVNLASVNERSSWTGGR